MISDNLQASSVTFSKTKSSPFETAFRVWHRRKTLSAHFLWHPISLLSPVSEQFVKEIILQIARKTSGLDPIPTKSLYKTLEVLLPTVTNILNKSLTSGTVPSYFKTAVVKPLFRKLSLDPNELINYRPTSNLATLSVKTSGERRKKQKKTCSSTTCLTSVNTKSVQHTPVCLPVREQHRDCSFPHIQRASHFPG